MSERTLDDRLEEAGDRMAQQVIDECLVACECHTDSREIRVHHANLAYPWIQSLVHYGLMSLRMRDFSVASDAVTMRAPFFKKADPGSQEQD